MESTAAVNVMNEIFNCRFNDANNRLDAFSGQSRSTNMVPLHIHIVSYCAIVTCLYDICLQKIS